VRGLFSKKLYVAYRKDTPLSAGLGFAARKAHPRWACPGTNSNIGAKTTAGGDTMAESAAERQGQPPPSNIKAVKVLNWFLNKKYGETISLEQDQCEIEGALAGSWVDDMGLKEAVGSKHPDIAGYLDRLCKEIYPEEQRGDPQEPAQDQVVAELPRQHPGQREPQENRREQEPTQVKKKVEPPPSQATCKQRIRGFGDEDPKCGNCADQSDCINKTLNRLTGIAFDISKNLLHSNEDADAIWREYGDDSNFGALRDYIHDVAVDYLNGMDKGEANDDVRRLNPWTVYYLNRMVPAWGERFKGFSLACIGPLEGSCQRCKWLDGCRAHWLNWAVRIPLFITRLAMRDISGNAFKVLTCIASHVNWTPGHPHFGMCWLKYDQIKAETGVKQPQHPIKELREKGHIQLEQITRRRKDDGEFSNTNCFKVGWFEKLRALGVDTNSKATKEGKKGGV
jgi:hypothetical protein